MTAMQTILIANRGEIALRLIHTARRMGYRTVAIYSDADHMAPHVRAADSACHIGPAPARDSYLHIDVIVDAARRHRADAVHPGYGFLAENADFAQAVQDAGLRWIGPPPAAMRAMGNKAAAKRLLADSDVPLLPGYQGADQDDAVLLREAARIGLPLMIKAAAGGGGRGMRLVQQSHELPAAIARARSEAQQAFGSNELILERALVAPRHVEVQVFADCHGTVVHLGERDCSVQRRHQKIIEEAPSPVVTPALRARLGAAAVVAARACAYVGAGTIEFLLDAQGAFWFMEMNTRLQVEHPVTEAITGLDLVEWQLRVAAGEALPLTQEQIDTRLASGGHAIEVRLCAEDPVADFLPQAGIVRLWRPPDGLRVEHALEDRQTISSYYDSMMAKLVAHADSRDAARRLLAQQLDACVLLGIPTNQDFLLACLVHPEFAAGRADTGFIAEYFPIEKRQPAAPDRATQLAAAGLLLAYRMRQQPQHYPDELHGWSNSAALESDLEFELDGARCTLAARPQGARCWHLRGDGYAEDIVIDQQDAHHVRLQAGSAVAAQLGRLDYAVQGTSVYFRTGGCNHLLHNLGRQPSHSNGGVQHGTDTTSGLLRAPMNGRVTLLPYQTGQAVSAGQTLIVLEAMKMEHALAAPCDGVLQALHVRDGEQVAPGTLLAEVTPAIVP